MSSQVRIKPSLLSLGHCFFGQLLWPHRSCVQTLATCLQECPLPLQKPLSVVTWKHRSSQLDENKLRRILIREILKQKNIKIFQKQLNQSETETTFVARMLGGNSIVTWSDWLRRPTGIYVIGNWLLQIGDHFFVFMFGGDFNIIGWRHARRTHLKTSLFHINCSVGDTFIESLPILIISLSCKHLFATVSGLRNQISCWKLQSNEDVAVSKLFFLFCFHLVCWATVKFKPETDSQQKLDRFQFREHLISF
jgi:hypothetical protein